MAYAGSFDANVILRLMLDDIPAQRKQIVTLFSTASGQFAVADVALVEVIFVLDRHYDYSRQAANETLRNFMSLPQINCNRALFDKALKLYVDRPALSFEDCALAVYAELNQATPLYTFDKKLATGAKIAQLVGKK